jgi:hypothetical protein
LSITDTSGYYQILQDRTLSDGMRLIIHINESGDNETPTQRTYSNAALVTDIQIPGKPVYVEKDESGKESIIYNSSIMKLGKDYPIEYNGEKWALRRTTDDVEFKKFYPTKR